MVKALTYITRRPGLSVEAFQEHWRTRHADVVVKLPGIRRYVQSHALPSGYARRALPFDGIAEIWFDDTDAMRALAGTPAYAAVQEDEARFIDRARMGLLLTEEHVIKDGPAPAGGVKSVELVTRKPGMDVDAFQRYWREVHGPIAATIPVLRRYVQSHVRRSAYVAVRSEPQASGAHMEAPWNQPSRGQSPSAAGRAPAYDGAALTWFDDTQAMRVSAATAEYARTRADEPSFLDTTRLAVVITREHVVVG